jgi:tRNA(adenine34) deaminase
MKEAFEEAEVAYKKGEVPVGAVITLYGEIIARGHNQVRELSDPTAHAELIAIQRATKVIKNERLLHTSLYVTVEPCPMCMGAIILARIEDVVYGASDPKAGACGSVLNLNNKLNHRVRIISGIMEKECSALMRKFFFERRKKDENIL